MKRALLVALAGLAVPALAAAQTAGTILPPTGFTSINIAQCNGAQNTIIGNDTLTIDLTWTLNTGSIGFAPSNGTVSLYVSSEQPAAGQGTGTSCTASSSNSSTFVAKKVANTDGTSDIVPTALTMTQTYSLKDIVAAASLTCTGTVTSTVYLCVQWAVSGNPTAGFATTTLTLDPTAPTAPSSVTSSPGDSVLHLSAQGSTGATSCKAFATSSADSSVHPSGQDDCKSLTIKGLTNNVPYSVVVYAINDANNPSPASAAITATPFPTQDFWNHYKQDGGQETGGCSTAAGAAGLLSALGLLLAVRRRKP